MPERRMGLSLSPIPQSSVYQFAGSNLQRLDETSHATAVNQHHTRSDVS